MRTLILATAAALALTACGRESAPEKADGVASAPGAPDQPATVPATAAPASTDVVSWNGGR